jgi:hypothetical protein
MSHNLEVIASETPNVDSEITATLSNNQKLGHALNKADGSQAKGNFDASTGLPSLASALKGDIYNISVGGTIYGQTWAVGDRLIINEDMGGTITNSKIIKASGNYAINDYYIFFLGADTYNGLVEISYDSLTVPEGVYFIQCVPTFGEQTSTSANTEIFLQFHDSNDNPVGNMMPCNLDYVYPTYWSLGMCTAHVVGPETIKLKVMATPTGTFPKDGDETSSSPFFLEVMRLK